MKGKCLRTLWVWIVLLMPMLFGCSHSGRYENGQFRGQSVRYNVNAPGGETSWERISVKNCDLAWFNGELNSTAMVNSKCENVDDVPLESLARHLMIGLTDVEVIRNEGMKQSGRDALVLEFSGELDGVTRRFHTAVLKKDSCVYDLVVEGPVSVAAGTRSIFDTMLASFAVGSRVN